MVPRAVAAAEILQRDHGITCEVIDLRSLVPRYAHGTPRIRRTDLASVYCRGENPRLCGWGAEIVSIVAEECFCNLDAPIVRITTPHIPLPAADRLEDAAIPSVERIVQTVLRSMG